MHLPIKIKFDTVTWDINMVHEETSRVPAFLGRDCFSSFEIQEHVTGFGLFSVIQIQRKKDHDILQYK